MWPTKTSPELKTIRYFLQDIRRNKCNYNFSVFVLFSETFDLPMYSPYLESQGEKKGRGPTSGLHWSRWHDPEDSGLEPETKGDTAVAAQGWGCEGLPVTLTPQV